MRHNNLWIGVNTRCASILKKHNWQQKKTNIWRNHNPSISLNFSFGNLSIANWIWNGNIKPINRRKLNTYLDTHGFLICFQLTSCKYLDPWPTQIWKIHRSWRNINQKIWGTKKSPKLKGDHRRNIPLEGLFFSKFFSRAIFAFCPLPPPMASFSLTKQWPTNSETERRDTEREPYGGTLWFNLGENLCAVK